MPAQPPESSLQNPATTVRWIVLGFVAFASASAYLTRHCIAAANTTIQAELSLNDEQMGWVLAAFALGYLLFQVPGGLLGNRFGTRFAFAFVSILWSLCNVWSGAAGVLASLCASRFWLGASQAGLTPLSAKILKDWIPHKNHGISSAAIGACMSVGGAFTLWMTGELLQDGYHWRGIFFAYSIVGVVWAIVFYWFFRTHPEQHASVNDGELALIHDRADACRPAFRKRQLAREAASEADSDKQPDKTLPRPSDANSLAASSGDSSLDEGNTPDAGVPKLWSLLASVSMWSLCVMSFFRAAGYAFFVTWFFAFLEYVYGIEKGEAGFLASLPLLAVVIGSISGGVIVDWLLRATAGRRISRCGTGMIALTICACLTLASAWTSSAAQLSTVMALGALFSGIANPASWAATIDLGGKHTAIVMGTMNMAGCLAGFMLPILLGSWFTSIKQSGGSWEPVIYLHAGFYFVAAAAWLFINPNRTVFET